MSVTLPPYSSQNILEQLKKETVEASMSKSHTMPGTEEEKKLSTYGGQYLDVRPGRRTLSDMTGGTKSTNSSGRSSRASGEFR